MDLSVTIWPLGTTYGFGKTENSIGDRRLKSNETVTVETRETRYLVQQIAKRQLRRPTGTYAETRSRNMAETAKELCPFPSFGGGAGSPSNTMSPGQRPTSVLLYQVAS